MTIDELRRLSREVEWTSQQVDQGTRDDGGAFEMRIGRFRERVNLARNCLVRGLDVGANLADAIRSLARDLSDTS